MFTHPTRSAILALLFLGGSYLLQAQSDTIYVKADAAGTNDGSSWEDAYPSLQTALEVAVEEDEIWVAQGTYFPDTVGGERTSTFLVDKNIQLLGGFSGFLGNDIPDPAQFITRLSGDLAQDDLPQDLQTNREDNVLTVLTVDLEVTNVATISGFYIQNGHADGDDSAFPNGRGGGCFSFGSPVISRCVFDQNFADEGGGGLYLHTGGAEGAQMTDCLFIENEAQDGGGAMCYLQGGEGVTFLNCDFFGNRGEDGGGLRVYNSNVLLNNCNFQTNSAERGGGMDVRSIWDDNETQVLNTFFSENQARHGGGINFQTSSGLGSHNNFLTLDGCGFFGNQATINNPDAGGGRQGGAIRANIQRTTNGCGLRIRNCDFTMNASERDGGAIAANMNGESMTFLLENTFVQDNMSRNAGGILVNASDVGSGTATVRSCAFFSNMAEEIGGGIRFRGNESSHLEYVVEGNEFLFNMAEQQGGALSVESRDTAEMDVHIAENFFGENTSGQAGGGISVEANGSVFSTLISRNLFSFNGSPSGSCVAVRPSVSEDATLSIDNCAFTENETSDAVLVVNGFPQTKLTNNTLADNFSSALHTANGSGVFFRNNIFSNFEMFEFATDNSVGELVSAGGNLVGDGSLDAFLGPLDQSNVDPVFEISPNGEYLLGMDSPAVDKGTLPDDVPEFDLAGNERVVNCIDAGAYESSFTVGSACLTSTKENHETSFGLSISPNPADELIRLEWDFNFAEAYLELLDVNGQSLWSETISNTAMHHMRVSNLPSGVYLLRMTVNGASEMKRVVVQ